MSVNPLKCYNKMSMFKKNDLMKILKNQGKDTLQKPYHTGTLEGVWA